MTDGSGNVTATYAYDVFGAIRSQSGSSSANDCLRASSGTPTAGCTTSARASTTAYLAVGAANIIWAVDQAEACTSQGP